MKVLLDTNVILDYLLARIPWNEEANAIYRERNAGRIDCCVTASSLTDIFHVARRLIGKDRAREAVRDCLASLTVIGVDRGDLEIALDLPIDDFEDAVQVASADEFGCELIITRDKIDFANSTINILSPTSFLKSLLKGPAQDL